MNILFNNDAMYSFQLGGELIAASELTFGQPLLLLDYAVRKVSVEMPIKQTRQIIKALPYAIEEQLANDVESNHVVYLGKKGAVVSASIISHNHMQSLIEQYNPSSVYDFAQLIPAKENTIRVAIFGHVACIMSDLNQGISMPASMLLTLIEREMSVNSEQLSIEIFAQESDQELLVAQLIHLTNSITQFPFADLLPQINSQLSHSKHLNLLTGQYAKKIESKKTNLGKFRFPLTVAVSLFALSISLNWMQSNSLNAQASAILQSSKGFYSTLFPEDNPSRMKRSFNEYIKSSNNKTSSGTQSFSSLLGAVSATIVKNSALSIDAIRFANNKQTLEINLTANTIAELDMLKKQLSEINLTTEIASANQDGAKIKGVIKVSHNG